jgi:hypothetical protein
MVPAAKAKLERDPTLLIEEYEYILRVLLDAALAMERSPGTFAKLKEEEIRDFLLILLNGHYEGSASSETFNAGGKTDILIRHHGQNAFIAECKFWRGAKSFRQAIEQVHSNTTWRDTKAAVLLFIRDQLVAPTLDSARAELRTDPRFKRSYEFREPRLKTPGVEGFIMGRTGDLARELILSVLAFQVPASARSRDAKADATRRQKAASKALAKAKPSTVQTKKLRPGRR